MLAFIFPGQGSQAVGMGGALSAASGHARAVFQEVDDALGQHLFRLMSDGPADELTLTENAQPAIMANALATLRVLEREGGIRLADKAAFVAGHSLGEYSALCAAEALGLAETARLLRIRGRAMQEAVPVGRGAMAALLGLDFAAVTQIAADAAENDVCATGSLGGRAPWNAPYEFDSGSDNDRHPELPYYQQGRGQQTGGPARNLLPDDGIHIVPR